MQGMKKSLESADKEIQTLKKELTALLAQLK